MEEKMSSESKEMLKLFISGGLIGDTSIKDERIREFKQKKLRNAYHNTELLLKNYRNVAWLLECFPEYIAEELSKPFENIDRLIDRLDVERSYGNKKVENKLESIQKTRLVVEKIHDALSVLMKYPKDGQRMYDVLYLTYVSQERLDLPEILYRLNISRRQYYRIRTQATSIVSLRLWAAPQKDMDFWIEMLVIFENKEKEN